MNRRHLLPLVETLLGHFPCVAVFGARQSGKTTLLDMLPGDRLRLDMERAADRAQLLADPDAFFRLHPHGVVIDEAPLAPAVFPALRVAIDRERARKGRFVLSGSSSPELVRRIAESLAGRIGLAELSPFSLGEAWQRGPSPVFRALGQRVAPQELVDLALPRVELRQVRDHWFHGGYPEPWLNADAEFRRYWQGNYVDTYLLRDVGGLFPQLNRDRFRQFLLLLGHLSGTLLNNAEIARSLGVSEPTVRDWLNIAHGTYWWRHLPAWERSPHKQLVKHPKGFMRDSGVLHRLLRIDSADDLATHPAAGRSWEAYVVEMLLRGFSEGGLAVVPAHFRTRGGAEIDLILDGDCGLLPVEIKLGSTVDLRHLRNLETFVAEHDCPLGLVVCNDERPRRLGERIVSIPAASL